MYLKCMIGLLLMVSGSGWAVAAPQGAVTKPGQSSWIVSDLPKAFRMAAGKRPIVVLTHADWCTPCKQLTYEVIQTPAGRAMLKDAICVKVNFEKAAGRKATKRFRILGLPTTLVLSPKGEEIGRIVGYPGKRSFTQAMKDLLAGKSDLQALQAQLKKSPSNRQLQVSYAQALLVRGKIAAAKKLLASAFNTKDGVAARAARIWGRYLLRVQRKGVEGTKHFLWAMRHFQKTPYRNGFLYWAAMGYHMQGKTAEALALFDDLHKRHPKALWPLTMKAGFLVHYQLKPAQAEILIRKALQQQPKKAWYHYMLAQVRAQQKDKISARTAIKTAIALQPRLAIYRFYATQIE